MDWSKIANEWPNFSEKVKSRWTALNEDDLERIDGARDRLVAQLQERYAIAAAEAEREVEEFEQAAGISG